MALIWPHYIRHLCSPICHHHLPEHRSQAALLHDVTARPQQSGRLGHGDTPGNACIHAYCVLHALCKAPRPNWEKHFAEFYVRLLTWWLYLFRWVIGKSCWVDDTLGHYFNDGYETGSDHSASCMNWKLLCVMLKQADFDPLMFAIRVVRWCS